MEFTPASGGRAKPVTKSQIRKLQAAYAEGEALAREHREREAAEAEKASEEIEDLLSGL